MKTLRLLFCVLILAMGASALQSAACAQQASGAAAQGAEAAKQTPIPLAPIATQLGQTLQTLVGTTTPQAPTAATPAENGEDIAVQLTDTFATGLLDTVARTIETLKANSATLTSNSSALPDFQDWLQHQQNDAHRIALWETISKDLLIIVGTPILIALASLLFLTPLRMKLKRNKPRTLPGRMGLLVGLFFLRLIPILIFLSAALLLLDQNETHRLPRFVVLNVIYALSLGSVIQQTLRGIFAPTAPHLRPFVLGNAQAVAIYRWLSAFSFVIVYSYFLIDVSSAVRVPASAIIVIQNFFALILTIMAIVVIFRTRLVVASILRGKIDSESEESPSFGHAMRAWLARRWHVLATGYLILGLSIAMLGIENGFAVMLRGTILSIAILVATRYAFIAVEKWRTPKAGGPAQSHRQFLAFLLRPSLGTAAAIGIAATWGVQVRGFVATPAGQRILGAAMSIALTLLILTVLYEMISGAIDRHLNHRDKITKQPTASARSQTLLPMVRHSIFILFCAVAILMSLSAIGVNIAPLLAGAGVLGVAIGFGSQTLVKDFLTGLFIVAESTIAVGDIVTIDTFSGTVEALSIRTIRLRDIDGALHILPFSEVSRITNKSKGFAYALVDVGVSYDSDLDRVVRVVSEVGGELQEDPVFKRVILEPIEVMGVESLGDSSIIMRARMRTRPGKQQDVRRLLLMRIKQRFDKEGIEIPFPTVTHVTKKG